MNAKSFFTKYHAVPATDVGVMWTQASETALMGWADSDCAAWDRDESARPHLVVRMGEIATELRRRNEVDGRVGANVNPRVNAILRISGRIGWTWLPAGVR